MGEDVCFGVIHWNVLHNELPLVIREVLVNVQLAALLQLDILGGFFAIPFGP